MATTSMTTSTRKALANRFYVAKSRAKAEDVFFYWETFSDWLAHFEEVCPPDFDIATYRVYYDLEVANEYSPKTMRLQLGAKVRMRVTQQAQELVEVPLIAAERRAVLASELSIRLLSYTPGTSFQEILRDSLASAGITT